MDFASLQIFKAVVEEGGISSAAKRLHRVQSNVTTRIQQLEASLGIKLFVREGRRLFLSKAGEQFLEYAQLMLQTWEQAQAAVLDDVPRGILRLGTLESTAASRLPPLLSRYHENHPAVRVELTTETTDALLEAVTSRELDAAFVADCTAAPHLALMPAFRENLVIIAPRTHPGIRRARDVQADTIICFPTGCAYRRRLQSWLGADGVTPERVLQLSSYHAIVACVASGAGTALVPRSVLRTICRTDDVAAYPLGARKGSTTTSLVWRKGEPSLALKALQVEIGKGKHAGRRAS